MSRKALQARNVEMQEKAKIRYLDLEPENSEQRNPKDLGDVDYIVERFKRLELDKVPQKEVSIDTIFNHITNYGRNTWPLGNCKEGVLHESELRRVLVGKPITDIYNQHKQEVRTWEKFMWSLHRNHTDRYLCSPGWNFYKDKDIISTRGIITSVKFVHKRPDGYYDYWLDIRTDLEKEKRIPEADRNLSDYRVLLDKDTADSIGMGWLFLEPNDSKKSGSKDLSDVKHITERAMRLELD